MKAVHVMVSVLLLVGCGEKEQPSPEAKAEPKPESAPESRELPPLPETVTAEFIMGLWAKVDGKRRFKGIYRNLAGEFRGTVRGSWRPFPADARVDGGVVRGHWRRNDGQLEGVIRGIYTVGDEPGQGGMLGHWKARCGDNTETCQDITELPAAVMPTCECTADETGVEACGCEVPPVETCIDETESTKGDSTTDDTTDSSTETQPVPSASPAADGSSDA